ncbi:MAG: hypothetical protein IJ220_05310 [Clostridia bacterium]|nr:hypothetical protein [Clostridia bacterium]
MKNCRHNCKSFSIHQYWKDSTNHEHTDNAILKLSSYIQG